MGCSTLLWVFIKCSNVVSTSGVKHKQPLFALICLTHNDSILNRRTSWGHKYRDIHSHVLWRNVPGPVTPVTPVNPVNTQFFALGDLRCRIRVRSYTFKFTAVLKKLALKPFCNMPRSMALLRNGRHVGTPTTNILTGEEIIMWTSRWLSALELL